MEGRLTSSSRAGASLLDEDPLQVPGNRLQVRHLGDEADKARFPLYSIHDVYQKQHCGPCYFREGFMSEIPTRQTLSFHDAKGLFGTPEMDPKLLAHVTISMGLIPPAPGESLQEYRKRREKNGYSRPTPKLFPFISALWKLMGYQPPLALALLRFCEGYSEADIARDMGQSLFGIHMRLVKATHIAKKWT